MKTQTNLGSEILKYGLTCQKTRVLQTDLTTRH